LGLTIEHIAPFWAPGGRERVILNLARYLPEYRHTLAFATDTYFFPKEGLLGSKGEPDVVHCHGASLLPRLPWRDIPVVVTFHNVPTADEATLVRELKQPVAVVAVSRAVADGISKNGLICTAIIAPGVDTKYLAQRVGFLPLNTWRARWRLPFLSPIVLWSGRLNSMHPPKDVALLFEVIDLLPRYHFLIVGDFYLREAEPKLDFDFEERVKALQGRVTWVPYVPPHAMLVAYRLADVVISTSEREGFGLVIAEAMAAGKNVVVPDVPALNELVSPDRDDGIIVERSASGSDCPGRKEGYRRPHRGRSTQRAGTTDGRSVGCRASGGGISEGI